MTRTARRWLIAVAIVAAALAVLAFFVSAGRALAAPVSNCNHDCDDGSHAMYAAIALGGVAVISTIVVALGSGRSRPSPSIPEARARPRA